MKNLQKVFNFSGGKTSAYMVIKYWQPGDLVIFCDTGREHEKTYKFINDFEFYEKIPVIKISWKNSLNPFRDFLIHDKFRLPYRLKRSCTEELKVITLKRYLKSIGIIKFYNYIGFRYDEPKRVKLRKQPFKKVLDKFPLYDDKIDVLMINEYWKSKSYTLEIPKILGKCTLCFMKGQNAILAILREFPNLATPWIEDEKKAQGLTYLPGITIQELKNIAQNNLFTQKDLNQITPAFNCACTS